MPIVRQISKLLVRGSLANVTMANLTNEQQAIIDDIVCRVTAHPEMARHRYRFIKELGGTIGADYIDDRAAAEEEFQIAVWRAAVNLLYHHKYIFRCKSCGAKSWNTKSKHRKLFERQYPVCPHCKCIRVTFAGDTNFECGAYIKHEIFQDAYKNFTLGQIAPKCESPINYSFGRKIYENPNDILDDDCQLVKFFCEFVWNYFRQTLKENNRVEHKKTPHLICGPGDYIITQEILSLCSRMKLDYNYCHRTQPEHGAYNIAILGLQAPPEFSVLLAIIRQKGADNNILVDCTGSVIKVHRNLNAPELQAYITKSEHVLVLDGYSAESNDENDSAFTISQISYRTVGVEQMLQENDIETVDANDVIEAVRGSLPDGKCKQVFDILSGQGQTYADFSDKFGDRRVCVNHIAKHLQITTRTVNQHKDTVKVQMLAHGMTPK